MSTNHSSLDMMHCLKYRINWFHERKIRWICYIGLLYLPSVGLEPVSIESVTHGQRDATSHSDTVTAGVEPVTLKPPRLHQRNMLRGRATCYGQQATCCPQHVARPCNLFPRNMLRWWKRGFTSQPLLLIKLYTYVIVLNLWSMKNLIN